MLNAGVPLEILTDICCFDSNGPKFDPIEFTKTICSTWVLVEPETRGYMDPVKRVAENPDTVESQFGNLYLDMGFMGRHTRRYIPKDEALLALKEKFHDVGGIEEMINTGYQETVGMLKAKGEKLKKVEEEYKNKMDQNVIDNFDGLMFWNDRYGISKNITNIIITLKGEVEESLAKKSNLIQIIGEAEEQGQLIKVLSQLIQEHQDLVLTRGAWDWIENESNNVVKRIVLMLLTFENNGELRKIYRAFLENKGLFYKYLK